MSDGEHYFAEHPEVESAPRSVKLTLPDLTMTLTTDRGVFSADRVDAGTKLLLLEGSVRPPVRRLCDLGCGYGAIALTLAHRHADATVWAVDVNERARSFRSSPPMSSARSAKFASRDTRSATPSGLRSSQCSI